MNIGRRTVITSLAGLPLAAVLADPLITRAVAAGVDTINLTTAGGKSVSAALAMPSRQPASAVLLIHEWWGLNDQIKSVAAELANQGYIALAVDLYDGKVADNPADARQLMQGVATDPKAATETLVAWVDWLKKHQGGTSKVGTIGWCFGGGWSLNASLAASVDATVIYYGDVRKSAAQLAALKGPVLGQFATMDGWINAAMVEKFEAEMEKAGKVLSIYWYEADHAFANPTQARYDADDAARAWTRTLAFFEANL